MAKMDFSGCDAIIDKLNAVTGKTDELASKALFEGAKVTADALREAIDGLPTEGFHPLPGAHNNGDQFGPLRVLTPDDKADLAASMGVAKFEHSTDGVSTSVGIAKGYSRHRSKRFPNGIPLPAIARSIESGSSARAKRPFVRPTARKAQGPAEAAMQAKLDELINQID